MSEIKQFGYSCNIEHELTHQSRGKGKYADWKKEYSNRLKSVEPTNEYPDVTAPFELNAGDTAYVVWCEWNEGDSFGNAVNGGTEVVGIFKDKDAAVECAKWIDEDDQGYHDNNPACTKPRGFVTSDGQVFKFEGYCPWSGYFERLQKVHVQMVSISPDYGTGFSSRISFS